MNNNGADQSAQMPRLVCTFVVRKLPKDRFSNNKAEIIKYVIPGLKAILYVFQAQPLRLDMKFHLFIKNLTSRAEVLI